MTLGDMPLLTMTSRQEHLSSPSFALLLVLMVDVGMTFTAPLSGAVWVHNFTHVIAWTFANFTSNVRISLQHVRPSDSIVVFSSLSLGPSHRPNVSISLSIVHDALPL